MPSIPRAVSEPGGLDEADVLLGRGAARFFHPLKHKHVERDVALVGVQLLMSMAFNHHREWSRSLFLSRLSSLSCQDNHFILIFHSLNWSLNGFLITCY